jgi:hypothetical protein
MLAILLRGLFFISWEELPGLMAVITFMLLWTLASWRLSRMGVYISDRGVRVRRFSRTRTEPWSSIARFEDQPVTKGLGSWSARILEMRTICVILRDGHTIETPLGYRSTQSTAFLPDSSFDGLLRNAAESPSIFRAQWRQEKLRMVASEQQCRAAMLRLRAVLRDSRKSLQPVSGESRRRGRGA